MNYDRKSRSSLYPVLKLTKRADYGLIALKHLAESETGAASAKEIGDKYQLPPEALAKILQRLTKQGLLVSQQGTHGGYSLAKKASQISALEVIRAIDGDVFLTSCSSVAKGCDQHEICTIREPLRKVNNSIRGLLSRIKISDMRDAAGDEADPMETAITRAESHAVQDVRELVTLGEERV